MKRLLLAAIVVVLLLTFTRAEEAKIKEDPRAPDTFACIFQTTVGNFTLNVTRDWAPKGVDHFYNLVQQKYYNDNAFFRVIPGFVVQFGINGEPEISKKWDKNPIKDDPVVKSNVKGTIAYATAGPDTRTTQLYINYGDNSRLDKLGFTVFGTVSLSDMAKVVENIYSKYREQPDQESIYSEGNKYLQKEFPLLDYIKAVTIAN